MAASNPNGCNFFVTRKKRFCRMAVKTNERYCAEHTVPDAPSNGENKGNAVRVVCPLDKKHTCYAHNLKKHLKICNARPSDPLPYICKGVNNGTATESSQTDSAGFLKEYHISDILSVISKVDKIYKDYISGKITQLFCKNKFVEEEISKTEGTRVKKHLNQASSLLGIVEHYELFKSDTCYIEFGAGKGHLSYWVYQAVEELNSTSVLLVERASHRHKFDNKLDKTNGRVHRIRVDIADLILEKVEFLKDCKYVFGIAKHLCGDATDLAMRCLMACSGEKEVLGLTMALCCHHRCSWSAYVGKSFFESVGLSKNDFNVMCRMVSWATCGTGKSRDWVCHEESNVHSDDDKKFENSYEQAGLTREVKEQIGRRCKEIIDWSRKSYLEEKGLKCTLHFYVEKDVSLENVCFVAHY